MVTISGPGPHVPGALDATGTRWLATISGVVNHELERLADILNGPIVQQPLADHSPATDDIRFAQMDASQPNPGLAESVRETAISWMGKHKQVIFDGVHGVRVVACSNPQPTLTPLPVGRMVLEAGVQLRYMFEVQSTSLQRQAAWLAYIIENKRLSRLVQSPRPNPSDEGNFLDAEFKSYMTSLGYSLRKRRLIHPDGIDMPLAPEVAQQMAAAFPNREAEFSWRLASGGAHSMAWMAHHELDVASQGRNPGAQLLTGANLCCLGAYVAITAINFYYGQPPSRYQDAVQGIRRNILASAALASKDGAWELMETANRVDTDLPPKYARSRHSDM